MSTKNQAPAETAVAITTVGVDPNQTKAVATLDALSQQLLQDAGSGLEDYNAGTLAIPFLKILQKNNPEADEANAAYVQGAKAGMFFNTVTGKLYDNRCLPNSPEPVGLRVISVKFEQLFVEWVPREAGGGIVGQHKVGSPVHLSGKPNKDKPMLLDLPNGNQLVETFYYYLLIVDDDENTEWVKLALKSTQLTPGKKWNTVKGTRKIEIGGKKIKAPGCSQMFGLTTINQINDFGSWALLKVTPIEQLATNLNRGAEIYAEAVNYRAMVEAGQIKEATPEDGPHPATAAGTGQDGEIPF